MSRPIRVLYVDDDPDLGGLTATLLEREDDRFAVETVRSAAEALDSIADLLTLARGGDAAGSPEPVSPGTLAEECWGVVPEADATLGVAADRGRLRQLLENLLANAVEHGGEDVTVTVGDLPDGFYVADDGAGVPESDRQEVFETGYPTAEDGTGFGLRIVEQIADAHGWSVRVTDGDEDGARFEVSGLDADAE